MQIVTALIAGSFTLLAAFIQPIVSRWAAVKHAPRRKRRLILWIAISTAVAVACIATFFFVRYVTSSSPQATITVPAGSEIQPGSDIMGRASDLPHDQLFLVLMSTGGGGLQYYPQAQVSGWTGANWTAALNANLNAGNYDLMAIDATDAEARGELLMYLQICQTTATCKGVDTIPEGVEILVSVPVNVTIP